MTDNLKSVPLVVYSNGVRTVIGTADVDLEFGNVPALVEKPLFQEILSPDNNSYSIASRDSTQTDVLEVAAILEPALRELRD